MGTGLTTKNCLLPLKHFKCFGCKADDFCHSKATISVSEVLTRQILSFDSESTESEEIRKVARRYLQEKESAEEARWKDIRRTPCRLNLIQAFPNQIVFTLIKSFEAMDLFLLKKHLLCTVRSEKRMPRKVFCDMRRLESHERSLNSVYIKPSSMAH